jgi:2-desacetyl-2-hydroxyethyl bacteriochlorophyllide A dehydrogenase
MKAAVFHKKHEISVEEIPAKAPGPTDVLIRVAYCGVCGTDLHIFHGDKGAAEVTPPVILGHEFSGVVAEVGSRVSSLKVGDRVCVDPNNTCGKCYACQNGIAHFCSNMIGYGTTTDGGFAEKTVVAEKQVYKIPDRLSLQEAAMAEPVSCCIHGIDLCHIRPGNTVLVIGGGPIGQMMVQLAKFSGAAKVILSEPVKEKREQAQKLGADLAVNPLEKDLAEELAGRGIIADAVIECVGNTKTIEQGIRCAGNGATVLMFGLTAPDAKIELRPFEVFQKELHITASYINPYTFPRALRCLASGRLDFQSIVTDIVDLDHITEVFYNDEYRKHGKILIKI